MPVCPFDPICGWKSSQGLTKHESETLEKNSKDQEAYRGDKTSFYQRSNSLLRHLGP